MADQVTVLEERGAWKKVSLGSGKNQGWMHNTALTNKRIALKAGQSNVGTSVTRDEIALAGKGFSEEVEAQYRKNNKNLDYTWINRMEAIEGVSGTDGRFYYPAVVWRSAGKEAGHEKTSFGKQE